ncbi:threonine/serine exporter family protein [Glutamicibacter sp. JL.03c]|uniref:threonine/serine ThrE exporter family protein n=1 Tax=Glutamicibacter sp. JL.03c TaxID=2984842 RepID=UPI0021F73033|nr:threonine/serine exporter family protein [Glutamicibacter sp. JL.03c]UYQ78112.1 threonine/serine exporter family protein [Glutamicibacter sp. JL.03c]
MAHRSDEEHGAASPQIGEDPAPSAGVLPRISTSEINMGFHPEDPMEEPATASELPLNTAVSANVAAADASDIEWRTGQVHTTDEGITLMPTRANPVARRLLAKMWISDTPPTQALNIVERLQGTPYANPKVNDQQDASSRRTMEFALDLGETLIRYGAGALEVETSIIAVTAALGLSHLDVDITNQSLHLNYSPPDAESYSVLRVVRSYTSNYAGLVLVHELVSDIIAGGVSRSASAKRLKEITRRPKPFPRWIVASGRALFAAAFVLFIGGSWAGALVAMFSSSLVTQIGRYGSRWRVPEFFTIAVSTMVITGIALIGHQLHAPLDPALVVSGGILLLLPSGRFVSALQDAINGFPVTAVGRLFSASLTYGAILSGIAAALVISDAFGGEEVDVHQIVTTEYPAWLLVLLVAVAIAAGAVTEQSALRLLLPTVGIAVGGYLIQMLAEGIGLGERAVPAIVATVIGFAARFASDKLRTPQLVLAAPAVMFLLPGLMIFRAMYGIVINVDDMATGLVEMFNAMAIMLSIAGGVVFGETLCRPLTSNARRERRRIRRR